MTTATATAKMSLILFSHSNDTTCKDHRHNSSHLFVHSERSFARTCCANSIHFPFRCQLMNGGRTKWQIFYTKYDTLCMHIMYLFIFILIHIRGHLLLVAIAAAIQTFSFLHIYKLFILTNLPINYSPTYSSGKLLSLHMNNNENTAIFFFFNDWCLFISVVNGHFKENTKNAVRISIIHHFVGSFVLLWN